MGFARKLKRNKHKAAKKKAEAAARAKANGDPIVWAVMFYRCADCGYELPMYLENTLERHNGENHKPVPFAIECPECGGFHMYDDIARYQKLPEERPLRKGESYFKDDPKYDCGMPVYRREKK